MMGPRSSMRDMLLQALTGSTEAQLHDTSAMGGSVLPVGPGGEDIYKATHALASQRISERFHPLMAEALGGAKELAQGGLSALRGGKFFGREAYDPADIEANYAGIRAAGPSFLEELASGVRDYMGGR
ncbi:MAG TPA: hypothetical protein VJP78_12765 [Thermoleophilia bacterium]|nr:hypothetical protein [Thermoleophilia bacterium]